MKRAFFLVLLSFAFGCARHELPTEPNVHFVKLLTYEAGTGTRISGATIELRESQTGPVLYSAKTDANGMASLSVPPARYWMKIVPPDGYIFGPADAFFSAGYFIPLDKNSMQLEMALVRST